MARTGANRRELLGREAPSSLSGSPPVLVVAPEPARAGEMVGALQGQGVPALQASTASQALFWARRSAPGLVLLDTSVQGSGVLLGELRREGRALVALNDSDGERIRALEAGCMDALPHSLEPDELALKVARLVHSDRGQIGERPVVAGPLSVDLSACRLVWKGEEIRVSPLLLTLAGYLAARPGQLIPARTLLEGIWREPWGHPNKVHQSIYRLRSRLGEPRDSAFLVAKRGHGYGLFPQALEARPGRSAWAASP